MVNTGILDVAIGLAFVFLLMSLVVTATNELISAWLGRRSATLWKAINGLLKDEKIIGTLSAHPLVAGMGKGSGKASYLDTQTFVSALLDSLTPRGEAPPVDAKAVRDALAKLSDPQGHLATSLSVLLHDAGDDIEKFRKLVGQWFDGSMDRVSGWYKRETEWIILVIATVLTVVANCDALQISNTLWHDPAVRSALVAEATKYVADHPPAPANPAGAETGSEAGPPKPPVNAPDAPDPVEAAQADLNKSVASLRALNIPLGWKDAKDAEDNREAFPAYGKWRATIYNHFLGWLITVLAISLGAPFWFDTLNRIISIRSTGKTPAEKKAEAVTST